MGIPYTLDGCDRTARHIFVVDKLHKNDVGITLVFGARTLQPTATSMSTVTFRVPFFSSFIGSVKTSSGIAVRDVTVTVCRIDQSTGLPDTVVDFCPLLNVTTDIFGEFSVDVRVSNVLWNNTTEYFIVTPSKTDVHLDGTIIEHVTVFTPATLTISLQHLVDRRNIVFTDKTTMITIFGNVKFDPANTGYQSCPFPRVPVVMVDATGSKTTQMSDSNGKFSFTVDKGTTASVYIPNFKNYQWNSGIDSQDSLGAERYLVYLHLFD